MINLPYEIGAVRIDRGIPVAYYHSFIQLDDQDILDYAKLNNLSDEKLDKL